MYSPHRTLLMKFGRGLRGRKSARNKELVYYIYLYLYALLFIHVKYIAILFPIWNDQRHSETCSILIIRAASIKRHRSKGPSNGRIFMARSTCRQSRRVARFMVNLPPSGTQWYCWKWLLLIVPCVWYLEVYICSYEEKGTRLLRFSKWNSSMTTLISEILQIICLNTWVNFARPVTIKIKPVPRVYTRKVFENGMTKKQEREQRRKDTWNGTDAALPSSLTSTCTNWSFFDRSLMHVSRECTTLEEGRESREMRVLDNHLKVNLYLCFPSNHKKRYS